LGNDFLKKFLLGPKNPKRVFEKGFRGGEGNYPGKKKNFKFLCPPQFSPKFFPGGAGKSILKIFLKGGIGGIGFKKGVLERVTPGGGPGGLLVFFWPPKPRVLKPPPPAFWGLKKKKPGFMGGGPWVEFLKTWAQKKEKVFGGL